MRLFQRVRSKRHLTYCASLKERKKEQNPTVTESAELDCLSSSLLLFNWETLRLSYFKIKPLLILLTPKRKKKSRKVAFSYCLQLQTQLIFLKRHFLSPD